MKNLSLFLILIFSFQFVHSQKDKCLTPTPPMGWNSWNWHGKQDINETIVLETIDAIVKSGLRDAGYEYVVIDGGWRDVKLGENGGLLPHPVKFPNGIKPLADYAHSKGLKFGLHTVPGTHDCGRDKVGGFGHEEVHIQQFMDWGLDFVKVDKCVFTLDENSGYPPTDPRWTAGWANEENVEAVYARWQKILDNCGRDIVFSISAYKYRDWYPGTCNMARTTGDINSRIHAGGAIFDLVPGEQQQRRHSSVMEIAEENNKYASFAGNCYWNDPDMMVTGNQGLSYEEQKAHFALWCIMSAPLFLGNDPRSMTDEEKSIIMNEVAISVNQDPTEQGMRIKKTGNSEIWRKKLSGGKYAVLILNRDKSQPSDIELSLKELGITSRVNIYDIFEEKAIQGKKKTITLSVEPRSCQFLFLSPG